MNLWYIYRNRETGQEVKFTTPRELFEAWELIAVIDLSIPEDIKKKVGGK